MGDIVKIIDKDYETLEIIDTKLQVEDKDNELLITSTNTKLDTSNGHLTDIKANQTNATQKTMLVNSTGEIADIDDNTNTLQVIDLQHQMVHKGKHFMYTDSITLANGITQDYLITTPNTTEWPHMTFYLDGSAITQWQFYEDSDKTGTTLQTIGNNNRNSLVENTTTIHKGTSGGTTDGTLIYFYKGGSATNQSRTETTSGNDQELILKQNTKYILRVTSGTDNNLTNVKIEWYEHINN